MFAILHIPSGTFLSVATWRAGMRRFIVSTYDIKSNAIKELEEYIFVREDSNLWLSEQFESSPSEAELVYLIEEFEIIEV